MSVQRNDITLGFRPRKWQQYALNKMSKYNALVVHRRAGKSVLKVADKIDRLVHSPLKNPQGIFAALTFSQAKKVIFQYFKDYLRDFPDYKASEKDLSIQFRRAEDIVKIYLAGSENPDTIRGMYGDDVTLDEFAFQPKSMYDKVVIPLTSDRDGSVTLISSVNGRNQFYHKYQQYKQFMTEGDPNYFALDMNVTQTGALSSEIIARLKKEMSEEAFRQEYMNDFGAGDASTYYGSYMERLRDRGGVTHVPYDPMFPVDVFCDLGMNDATAIWFRQTVGREFRYINYMEGSGFNIRHWVQEIRKLQYGLGRVVLPHDAAQREFSTGKTRQAAFTEMGLRTEIQPKQKIQDGIEAVRNHLPKCVFDSEKCLRGLECLENYRKRWDDRNGVFTNTPVHNEYSHGADGFRYAALDERPSHEDMQRRRSSLPEAAETDYNIFGGY